jgi:hypothetical protein
VEVLVMEKSKELLNEIETDVELRNIIGGWNPGPSQVWGAIMDAVTGGCSWGDAFAGQNNPKGPLHGTCTRP